MNIYAPNEDCPKFLSTIESKLLDFCNSPVILGEDLNLALKPQVNKSEKINQPKKSVFTLLKLMHASGLVDIWRTMHNDVRDLF